MAQVLVSEDYLDDIGDAIRGKLNVNTLYKPGEMAAAIESIKDYSSVVNGNIDAYVDRSVTECSSDTLTKVGNSSFVGCQSLISVSFPNATSVGSYAFDGCDNLASVNLPLATNIHNNAFENCWGLESISFPEVVSIGVKAFYDCMKLVTIDFPKATSLQQDAFRACVKLERVVFPEVITVNDRAFKGCIKLAYVDLHKSSSLVREGFYDCSALTTLILRKTDAICSLEETSVFTNTPIASGTGYIYVPSALVNSYKTDSSWSTYANQIRAIEDYPDITGG